jgi:hypothetical protein
MGQLLPAPTPPAKQIDVHLGQGSHVLVQQEGCQTQKLAPPFLRLGSEPLLKSLKLKRIHGWQGLTS